MRYYFRQFGLGVARLGIDLRNESIGQMGRTGAMNILVFYSLCD